MYLNGKQYLQIGKALPKQRGNVCVENRLLLEALIFRCKTGCAWRDLPGSFGRWHTVYTRLNRWAKNGVLERVYMALAAEGLMASPAFSLDSTVVKAHPDAHGEPKKRRTGYRQDTRGLEPRSTPWRPATALLRAFRCPAGTSLTRMPDGCCRKRWNRGARPSILRWIGPIAMTLRG